MNSQLYVPLVLPLPLLKTGFYAAKYSATRQRLLDMEDVSSAFIKWLHSLGVFIVHADVFYTLPNTQYAIHKDHFNKADFPKLNIIYSGQGSTMNWYTVKPGKTGKTTEYPDKNPYVTFDPQDVELLQQHELLGTNLVQAGIPHNVTATVQPRWCISMLLLKTGSNRLLTWQEATDIFGKFAKEL